MSTPPRSAVEICFDESGHTGYDLLNADQPVFALASTSIDTATAQRLIDTHFAGLQAAELKHADLASRERGRRRVLALLADLGPDTFAVEVWHKEYTLLSTLVDAWIEVSMYRAGVDLYDRGGNIALANMLYYTLSAFLPPALLRSHLLRYQTMMRERTRESYDWFWGELRRLFDIADDRVRDVLIWLLGPEMHLGYEHLRTSIPGELGVTYSSIMNHVSHWADRLACPLVVVHDASTAIAKDKATWEAILTADIPPIEIGYDRRKMKFPLGVTAVRLENSRANPALQLVDILAGAMATIGRNSIEHNYRANYAADLRATLKPGVLIGGVWPSPDVSPEELGTVGSNAPGDPHTFIGSLIPDDVWDEIRSRRRTGN